VTKNNRTDVKTETELKSPKNEIIKLRKFTRKTDTQTTYCHGWMDGLSGCFEKIAEMLFQKKHARKTDVKCDIRSRDGDFFAPPC
jgi:hypothetical protein